MDNYFNKNKEKTESLSLNERTYLMNQVLSVCKYNELSSSKLFEIRELRKQYLTMSASEQLSFLKTLSFYLNESEGQTLTVNLLIMLSEFYEAGSALFVYSGLNEFLVRMKGNKHQVLSILQLLENSSSENFELVNFYHQVLDMIQGLFNEVKSANVSSTKGLASNMMREEDIRNSEMLRSLSSGIIQMLQDDKFHNFPLKLKYQSICSGMDASYVQEPISEGLKDLMNKTPDHQKYAEENLVNSYESLIHLGCFHHNMLELPVLQVAPGHYGFYINDNLRAVMKPSKKDVDPEISSFIQKHTKKSFEGTEFEGVYTMLQEVNFDDPNEKEEIKQYVKQFIDFLYDQQMKSPSSSENARILIDVDQCRNLHPDILNMLLQHNMQVLRLRFSQVKEDYQVMHLNQYVEKAFLGKEYSEDEKYFFLNLMKLNMRKKFEDMFGVSISNYNFWLQRQFLFYFITRSEGEIQEVQNFLARGGEAFRNDRLVMLIAALAEETAWEDKSLYSAVGRKIHSLSMTFLQRLSKMFYKEKGGHSLWRKILRFSEKSEYQDVINKLFRAYSDTLQYADTVCQEILLSYKKHYGSGILRDAKRMVFTNLVTRAQTMIESFFQQISSKTGKEKQEQLFQELMVYLFHADHDVLIARSLAKALSTSKSIRDKEKNEKKRLDEETSEEETDNFYRDVEIIKSTRLLGPITGKDFLENPEYDDIRDTVFESVKKQFPRGDDVVFKEDFLNDPTAQLYLQTCIDPTTGKRILLMFVGCSELAPGSNYYYFDWFIANPDAKVDDLLIRGLGESFLPSVVQKFESNPDNKEIDEAGVCKPFVRSMYIAIEKMGYVGYSNTDEGEYKHHYIRIRKALEELEKYESKYYTYERLANLLERYEKLLESYIENPTMSVKVFKEGNNKIEVYERNMGTNSDMSFCEVRFENNKLPKDGKVHPDDPDGLFFKVIEDMEKKGLVLTRYVPTYEISDTKKQRGIQEYFCVFERSKFSEEGKTRLDKAYEDHRRLEQEKKMPKVARVKDFKKKFPQIDEGIA